MPEQSERQLGGSSARRALILLLLINLFNYVDRYILAEVEAPISRQMGVSMAAMGWLVTGFLLSYMVLSPVFGVLADRFPRWVLIGVGVILWSLASGGSGLARTYSTLLLMRCLIGVGEAAYGPVAPTLIADLYPVAVRGKVLAWFYAAIPVGSAIGYIIGGQFAEERRWPMAFYLTVPPGVILGIWCFLMPEPRRGSADYQGGAVRRATWSDYLALLRIRSYVINCAAMTAMTFAIGGMAFWMPRYLNEVRGIDKGTASLVFGIIMAVCGLLATLSGGIAGDRLRGRFPGAYFLVSGFGMLIGFPLILLMLVTPFPANWGVIALAAFFLFFNTGPSNTALANVTHPSIRATAFAMNIFVIHALGDAISPPVLGAIADRWSMKVAFAVMSVTVLLGGLLWLWGARYLGADTAAVLRRSDESDRDFRPN